MRACDVAREDVVSYEVVQLNVFVQHIADAVDPSAAQMGILIAHYADSNDELVGNHRRILHWIIPDDVKWARVMACVVLMVSDAY